MGDAPDLEALRRAIEETNDPEERRHLERKLKITDPATRDAFIATLVPPLTPGDYIAAGVDPPHYDDDPFILMTDASRAKHEAAYQAAFKYKRAKMAQDE